MKDKTYVVKDLFAQIGVGKKNILKRPGNSYDDRILRKKIQEAQESGDIIINVGEGYYRPILAIPEEKLEFEHYINSKKSRINAHARTIAAMERTAKEMINNGKT